MPDRTVQRRTSRDTCAVRTTKGCSLAVLGSPCCRSRPGLPCRCLTIVADLRRQHRLRRLPGGGDLRSGRGAQQRSCGAARQERQDGVVRRHMVAIVRADGLRPTEQGCAQGTQNKMHWDASSGLRTAEVELRAGPPRRRAAESSLCSCQRWPLAQETYLGGTSAWLHRSWHFSWL